MKPEDKIQCVLDLIKEQYDLSPKGDYSVSSGPYGRRYDAGEVRISTEKFCAKCSIEYIELEKILATLKEDGLISKFQIISEYV